MIKVSQPVVRSISSSGYLIIPRLFTRRRPISRVYLTSKKFFPFPTNNRQHSLFNHEFIRRWKNENVCHCQHTRFHAVNFNLRQ